MVSSGADEVQPKVGNWDSTDSNFCKGRFSLFEVTIRQKKKPKVSKNAAAFTAWELAWFQEPDLPMCWRKYPLFVYTCRTAAAEHQG